ncbi:MAG: histidine phosphatase family protein [Proteobacteria bacterium]|nr:histidine phosphatase family protein [Pseudomonadota bacterium]
MTLVRHAKSDWKNSTLTDRQRPLNKRGERDAPVMGRRIVDHGIRPSLIIVSPAVRAWTTATLIAREINYPFEFLQREDALYLASLDDLLAAVMAQDDGFNSLMVVAHNPGLTQFADYLSPGITANLPTAGVVSVQIEQDDWNLYERPQCELLVHDYPKLGS